MATSIYLIIPLVAGYLLDLLVGDPPRWPHPVKGFGLLIEMSEKWLNRPPCPFLQGMAMTGVLCTGVFAGCYSLSAVLWTSGKAGYLLLSSIGVFYGLANRSLVKEGKAVFEALQKKGTEAGRLQLSRIVGRDTAPLGPPQIRIAVFETLSENLSDGVIAPLFYYALAGLPGMWTYKMINTLDSMTGYRNDRYEMFGKFPARLDDLANFIPSRLTALLMVMVTLSRRGARFIVRYGQCHKSPNAGYPEAALAGILDLRFGGTNVYQGIAVEKPFIGENSREIQPEEIDCVCRINHRTCLLMVLLITLLFLGLGWINGKGGLSATGYPL
ncbi:MAG: adenosylcobinamide-phosphate synthase CbiB [Puia sp.]|nr:adenosylcobinamide-phosphate synthase CbiB [Puia sp.]